MKTLIYLPTLLALTIQVMVSGQTQGNQARKIRVDIMGPKEPVKMNYTNSNITMSITEYNQLLEQANSLKTEAEKLKKEVASVEYASLLKQIQISQMSAHISFQKFEQNRKVILNIFPRIPKNNITYTKAQSSYTESERFMKLAKEIREEANAQLTIQAQFGNMSNAEEKETLALAKQQEVLNLFAVNYPQLLQQTQDISEQDLITTKLVSETVNNTSTINTTHSLADILGDHIKQAEDMKNTAQQLRNTALTSSLNQKTVLINEAISLEADYIAKQLEVSALRSKLDYEKFCENRAVIASLMDHVKDNEALVNKATQLNNEAEYLMKMGKELREEANAQLNNAAKYGAMSNAEEKETLALHKQTESISIIETQNSKSIVANKF